MSKRAESQGKEGSSKTEHKTEKRHFQVVVVFVNGRHLQIVLVVRIKIRKETYSTDRITQRIEEKDGNDQEGKHFVGESGSILENPVEVDERGQKKVDADPNADPRIERQERHSQGFRELKADRLEGKDGPRSSVDTHWHTANESIGDAVPTCRAQKERVLVRARTARIAPIVLSSYLSQA